MALSQMVLLDPKHIKRWLDKAVLNMKTSLGSEGKLSRPQITRLGGLIAFVGGRTPYQKILDDLTSNGFLVQSGNGFELTSSGRNELNRLTAMAGLRPEHYADTNL